MNKPLVPWGRIIIVAIVAMLAIGMVITAFKGSDDGIGSSTPAEKHVAVPEATDDTSLSLPGGVHYASEDAFRAYFIHGLQSDGQTLCDIVNNNAWIIRGSGTSDQRRALDIQKDECDRAGY